MERPDWAPEGIDLERPSAARVYDYWLGGCHNFAVDRELGRQAVAAVPDTVPMVQANRAFLHRAVLHLAGAGIRQFLDIGSGVPTLGNVHEVAQRAAPDARVAYADIDPVAVAHSRAILGGNERATVIQEDLRRPRHILANPAVRRLIDFDRPVGLLLVAVLHFLDEADDPCAVVATLRDVLAPGSFLVVSHGTADSRPEDVALAGRLSNRTPTPATFRSKAEVERFFDGFELIDPGLVWAPQWRPEHPDEVGEHPERACIYAGVGMRR